MTADPTQLQQKLRTAFEVPRSSVRTRQTVPMGFSADLMRPVRPVARIVSLMLIITVLAGVAWSRHAVVEEVTKGEGRVIPASKVQVVQNLEGGIILDILARNGQQVAKGDLLVRIDPTGAGSSLAELRERSVGLQFEVARLSAEVEERALDLPKSLAGDHPELAAQQRRLFETRNREIAAALSGLDLQASQKKQEIAEATARMKTLSASLKIALEERKLILALARDRAASKAEVLAIRAKVTDLEGQLEAVQLSLPRINSALKEIGDKRLERKSNFRAQTLAALYEARIKLASISQLMKSDADKVTRTEVRSPVDGIVKTVHTTTLGQVVKPGEDLVEIVPLNDSLLIEARVSPRDIAFLSFGQRAVVKITAYDYALYGALKGQVEKIGADSIVTEKGEAFYLVEVRTKESSLELNGQMLPIKPGMVAHIDIITGEKTIFSYLTKPFHRMANESFREK